MASLDAFGAVGYGVTAVLFFVLAALLVTAWRGRMQGALLVVAAFASAVWAAGAAVHAGWHSLSMHWIWTLEALRDLVWVIFLLGLLEIQLKEKLGLRHTFLWLRLLAFGLAALLMLPIEDFAADTPALQGIDVATLRLALQVLFPVAALVLVEQVYRNTPWEHRWGVKFLCFGIGALFAYDFYFFADALLFKRLDPDIWLARGAANALVVPLIAVSVARNPQWSFDLFVSRRIVFHTTSLVAAGIYLLVMSLAGYYIRLYGGEWSSVFQAVFFFGAALVLVVLLFSGYFRSRVKVFINKHFFSYKYDYREEWLHLIGVLSGDVLQATLSERIIFALGELVDSPGGALWLCSGEAACEHERSWNLPGEVLGKGADFGSLYAFLSARRWIVNLDEYESDPDAYDGLTIPTWVAQSKRLWLIVPLFHDDDLLGFVMLERPRARQQLNWETLDLLKTAARQAASYVALERAAKALADARQFEGFNRLSAFVVHDLKNLIAQLSLVARNAERHKDNPAFMEDAIATVRNSVDKMSRLLAQLRSAMPGSRFDRVELGMALREVVAESASRDPRPRLVVETTEEIVVYADRDRLLAVVGHIIQNAQEATSPTGAITARLSREGPQASIEIADDGIGMDAAFIRDRLFKPFDSTKGLTGMGIGAYECREFIRALGGRVEVSSSPGAGTRFTMILPMAEEVGEPRSLVTESG
ncbi:MAG: XrtA/PEP-CTERM system histidine kinase PrsK [Chromatiaceae bacterium]